MPGPSIDQLVAETLAAMKSGAELWVPDNGDKAHLGTRARQERFVQRSVADAMVEYGFVTPVEGSPEGFKIYQRKSG